MRVSSEFDMWPKEQVETSLNAREKMKREEYELASQRLDDDIAKQRAAVGQVSNALFQRGPSGTGQVPSCASQREGVTKCEDFRKWVEEKGIWKLDRKSRLNLDIPTRLRDIERPLSELYLQNQEADLDNVLDMCATSTRTHLLQAIAKRLVFIIAEQQSRGVKREVEGNKCQAAVWKSFRERIAESLFKLQKSGGLLLRAALQR